MKRILFFVLIAPFLLSSCAKEEPITSVVGTYKLGFNAASDGWKLVLNEDGTGSLTHMSDWEYDGQFVSNFKNCKSFTYVVNGDNIEFKNCTIGLNYDENDRHYSLTMTITGGPIEWGYTKGSKIHGTILWLKASVKNNGLEWQNSPWGNASSFQCDNNGNTYH